MTALLAFLMASGVSHLAVLPRSQDPVDVEVQFHGNQSVADRTLRRGIVDPLTDVEAREARPADVDDASYELELFYHSLGYPFAEVAWEVTERPGVRHVDFHITEGPRTTLAEVTIVGNQALDDATLRELLTLPRDGLLGNGPELYVADLVESFPGEILHLYRGQGYLQARISAPDVRFSEDRRQAWVVVSVEEGTRSLVGEITFEGNATLDAALLRAALEPMAGTPYQRRRPFELRSRIEQVYGNSGYPSTEVEVEEQPRDARGHIALHAIIEEGPRVRIGQILVEGQEETKEHFIRSRIAFEPGDLWSDARQNETFQQLYSSGLFTRVDVQLLGDGPVRDLRVTVEDGNSREVFIKPGYGSYERLRLAVGFTERNLFGTGRAVTFETGISTVGESAHLTFTDPWFLGRDLTLNVPFHYYRREEPSYTERSLGVGVAVRKRFTTALSATVGAEVRQTRAEDVDPNLPAPLQEDLRVSSLFVEGRHDTRNNPFNPSRGHGVSVRVNYGTDVIGSELNFVQVEATLSQLFPVTRRLVLAAGARSAFIVPLKDTDVIPLQERLFNGGQNSVRSFKYSELGPKDTAGDPVGGEASTTLNLELRYDFGHNIQGAVFYDTGNVALDFDEYFEEFRSGVGTGVRYLLPVGAIRLDVGFNPHPRDDEDDYAVHLSIGMAF